MAASDPRDGEAPKPGALGRGVARAISGYLLQHLVLRLGLHRRIAVFVSSILLAVFLAFGFLGWQAIERTMADTLVQRRLTAEAIAGRLDAVIDDAESDLVEAAGAVTDDATVRMAANESSSPALEMAVQHARRYFSQLVLFDAAGNPGPGAPALANLNPTPELTALVDDVRRARHPGVSGVVRLPVAGTQGLLFAAPLTGADGLAGVIVAEMQLPNEALATIGSGFDFGETGHFELVDRHGRVIVASPARAVGADGEHNEYYASVLASGRSAAGRAQRHMGSDDSWHVVAFAPLKHAPWGVAFGQSENEAFAASRELRDQALAVAAVALAIALCAAWLGTRSVVRPILALTRAGQRMATGDLSDPIRVAQPDEIGSLADALEAMREQLRASMAQINQCNLDLEQRVSERTQALETSNRHLRSLMAVATASGRCPDRESILQTALAELVGAVNAESAWAYLWDESRSELRLVAGHNMPPSFNATEGSVRSPRASCMLALRSPRACSALRARCPALSPGARRRANGQRCWTTAMRVGDNAFGVLALTTAGDRQLGPDATALMQGVADEVAVALENARLAEERTQLEAARRMEVLRAELLASVSHELRTPLGFIKGYTTSLLRKTVTWEPEEQREFLEIIDEETDHLTEMVDGILDVARARAGRLELRFDSVDLEQVIRRSLERMSSTLEHRDVQLIADGPALIVADDARLQQVVVNLLQNAAKYSPETTPIELRLESSDGHACFAVLDRGVGLTAADATRIFEPFYRVQDRRTARVGGAGLGLAICRAIVDGHGGRIWAEPRAGGGTAVNVELPGAPRPHME